MSERSAPHRKPGPLGELERRVEQRDRRRDARELVAADADAHEDVGAVDVGELRALCDLTGRDEEVERLAHLTELLERPRLAGERAELERRRRRSGARPARPRGTPRRPRRSDGRPTAPPRARAAPRPSSAPPSRPRRRGRQDRRRAARRARRRSYSVGRVLPRSIWLMYSFEKRAPASCVWVRPADTRSVRRRSPRRAPAVGAGDVAVSYMPISVNSLSAPPRSPGWGMCGYRFGVK